MHVLGFVATQNEPTTLKISIPSGVATGIDGSINIAAESSLVYQPASGAMPLLHWATIAQGNSRSDAHIQRKFHAYKTAKAWA